MLRGNPPVSLCSTAPLVAVSYTHLDVYKRQISHRVKDEVEQATGLKVARVIVSVDDVIA